MKLWRPFKWDKANHALYGAAIYIILRLFSVLFGDFLPDYLCFLTVGLAGVGLEVYQGITDTGTPDWRDASAVVAPALILYVLENLFI